MRRITPPPNAIVRIAYILIIMVLYQTLSLTWKNPFFPRFELILGQLSKLANFSWLIANVAPTILTLITGYIVGVSLGVITGIGLSYIPNATSTTIALLAFGRAVPSIAKITALFAIFGISKISQICSVFLAVYFIMSIATFDAYRYSKNELEEFAALYSLSEFTSLLKIYLKSSSKLIFTSSKFAFQVALITTLISEMYSSAFGIGAYVMYSQASFNPTGIWGGIFIVGILGIVFSGFFTMIERSFFNWESSEE